MPKTIFQSIIFTTMIVFCMVYCMTVYTISLNSGGLSYGDFLTALKEMWVEFVVVFLLIFCFVTKTARKLALRIFNPENDNPMFLILSIQSFTVCIIVPLITLFATFFHNGFTSEWFVQWITLAFTCYPMAFFLQIFLVGPLVRNIFRLIFK